MLCPIKKHGLSVLILLSIKPICSCESCNLNPPALVPDEYPKPLQSTAVTSNPLRAN